MEKHETLNDKDNSLAREAGDAALGFLKEFPHNNASQFLNESVKNALFVAYCSGYQAGVKARDAKPKLILQ